MHHVKMGISQKQKSQCSVFTGDCFHHNWCTASRQRCRMKNVRCKNEDQLKAELNVLVLLGDRFCLPGRAVSPAAALHLPTAPPTHCTHLYFYPLYFSRQYPLQFTQCKTLHSTYPLLHPPTVLTCTSFLHCTIHPM